MALTEEEEDELRRIDLEQKRLDLEQQRLEVEQLRNLAPAARQKGCHDDFQTCLGTIIVIALILLYASCPSGPGADPWIPPKSSSE